MRIGMGLLVVLLLAATAIVRAQSCPGSNCIYIPTVARPEHAAPSPRPSPSAAPSPPASTAPSAAPTPSAAPVARWNEGSPSPIVRSEAEGVAVGSKLFVFGGYSYPLDGWTPYSRVDVYDVASDTWVRLRDLPRAVNHSGVTTDGTYVYLAGGYVANSSGDGAIYGSRDVLRYDIATDSYSSLPSLPEDRAAGSLVLVGRELHFFGGTNRERTVDTGEHWALALDAPGATWQPRRALPNARNHLGAVALGGLIYAIGGQHDHDAELTTQRDVHRYDPATDTWTAVAPLPEVVIDGKSYGRGHIGAATFVRGGKIVVAGGEYDHMLPLDDAVEYDPATNTWQPLLTLPATRYSGVARQIGDKFVYVTGGTDEGRLTNTTLIGTP